MNWRVLGAVVLAFVLMLSALTYCGLTQIGDPELQSVENPE